LRERQGDIPLLANHFAAQMAHELGRTAIPEFSDEAIEALESYPWPGNIRELKNAVERAVYRSDSAYITDIVFDPFSDPFTPYRPAARVEEVKTPPPHAVASPTPPTVPSFHEAVQDFEVQILKRALVETRHHQRKAAQRLGLTYHQFRGLYRKYRDWLES
jgi:psp operon transcriptional activator